MISSVLPLLKSVRSSRKLISQFGITADAGDAKRKAPMARDLNIGEGIVMNLL
jgi:hypothetical protein